MRRRPPGGMPKGKHKRGANSSTRSGSGSGDAKDDGDADALFYLRTKYSLLGKSEWWWLMDESLAEIHRRLETENFVVVDGFVPPDATRELRDEIRRAHDAGHLAPGVLAGGKAGDATQYTMRDVRGDHVGWFSGSETADGNGGDPLWRRLPDAMKRADTLVHELGQLGGDARDVASRSKAMCTVYPGAGARYVRHVDNPDRNGRLLTALLYLNPEWQEGDGGELRVFRCLRADGADAAAFADCDGRSLAAADGFGTAVTRATEATEATEEPVEGDEREEGAGTATTLSGAKDVSEGVRDVATLRGPDDGDAEKEPSARKKPVRLTDVAPLGGRLVLFKSDARVPHEVLAASKPRFAVTLWYFHGEEVAAARRGAPASVEQREAQEAKIKREIQSMTLKYGGGADGAPAVRVRASRNGEWSSPATTESPPRAPPPGTLAEDAEQEEDAPASFPALPRVAPPCEARWEAGVETAGTNDGVSAPTLVVRAPLPAGARASACSAEVEPSPSDPRVLTLSLRAPGLPGAVRVALPPGADADAVAVTLVKKPSRALVVRVSAARAEPHPAPRPADRPPVPEPSGSRASPRSEGTAAGTTDATDATDEELFANAKDCVGVGGMYLWSSATSFSALPPPRARAAGVAPRGVDLRGAVDWDDFASARWALAGRGDERPTLTPHALDGLSFPVTLARVIQQPRVAEAIRDARRGATARDVFAAARAAGGSAPLGDGDSDVPPLTVLLAGASARTEQFLLERTAYWAEAATAAPPARGGVHLAFIGPDADVSGIKKPIRRLAPSLTASVHRETAGAYLSRLTSSAPCLVMGFNTGLGGGGGALARAWASDLAALLRRPNTPAAFTCANAFADLAGELAVFRALGARFVVPPAANPFRAYTHAMGEASSGTEAAGAEVRAQASCANAFAYAVLGFEENEGPASGASDDRLRALAAAAAARAAGKAWDALGMER